MMISTRDETSDSDSLRGHKQGMDKGEHMMDKGLSMLKLICLQSSPSLISLSHPLSFVGSYNLI